MELLLSNYPPAKYSTHTFKDFFEKNLSESETLKIASGFISSESLTELKKIIQDNKSPKVELLIGMHYFDGFTKTQYQAAIALAEFLKESKLGNVYLATVFKFHGKMYCFGKSNSPYAAVIGSSNFSSVFSSVERLYETDVLLTENKIVGEVDRKISKLFSSIAHELLEVKIDSFKEFNPLLENHDKVEKVSKDVLGEVKASLTDIHFEIPINANDAPKSNLNVFFGKGRENQRGYTIPRPWYEVELIVPNKITQKKNYPYEKIFTVITDDGWQFKCRTSGSNSKNFRSQDDLKILGKWIKGRLEQSGALKIGEPVTDDVLNRYGRNSFSLIKTEHPDVWLIDFKV